VPPPAPVPKLEVKRELRRYRTGRIVQLNINVSPETFQTFYNDHEGWVLGEAFEHAVKALQDAPGSKSEKFGEARKPQGP